MVRTNWVNPIADLIGMTQLTKSVISVTVSAALIGGAAGCQSDTGNGALIGGGIGALAGGIIGHQSGHAVGGALIGGAVGAGTGALIGHASDEKKKDERDAYNRGYDDARRDNRSTASNGSYYR